MHRSQKTIRKWPQHHWLELLFWTGKAAKKSTFSCFSFIKRNFLSSMQSCKICEVCAIFPVQKVVLIRDIIGSFVGLYEIYLIIPKDFKKGFPFILNLRRTKLVKSIILWCWNSHVLSLFHTEKLFIPNVYTTIVPGLRFPKKTKMNLRCAVLKRKPSQRNSTRILTSTLFNLSLLNYLNEFMEVVLVTEKVLTAVLNPYVVHCAILILLIN